MSKLSEYLNRHIIGNVFDQNTILEAYATNASPLRISPEVVAFPETVDDVRRLVHFADQLAARGYKIGITPRGNGCDKTGASIGPGLIISTRKLNVIEELDSRARLVRVQPGVTLGELNSALALHGLCLPVGCDPKNTIGGLIANTPSDSRAARSYGIENFVDQAEIVLPSGEIIQLQSYNSRQIDQKVASKTAEGQLYRAILHILDEQADTILDRSMRPYDAAGYANIVKVRTGRSLNLLPLLFASQGTLGMITSVVLNVEPLPSTRRRMLVSFHDLKAAQRFLNYIRDFEPYSLQIFDLNILEAAAATGKKSDLFTRKFGKGLLALIGFDFRKRKSARCIRHCLEALPNNALRVEESDTNHEDFQEINNLLVSYLNSDAHGQRLPIIDEVYIPSMHFGEFLEGLRVLEKTLNTSLSVFGSFAACSYSVRPDFDLTSLDGRRKIGEYLRLYTDLVVACHGSITGIVPEGRTKTYDRARNMSNNEKQLYLSIKSAFDPHNIFNPGVKLGASPSDIMRYLDNHERNGVIEP